MHTLLSRNSPIVRSLKSRAKGLGWVLVFLAVLLAFFFSQYVTQLKTIEQRLRNIPQQERETLEKWFRSMFSESALCYTIFGDKPITHIGYWVPEAHCRDVYSSIAYIPQLFEPNNLLLIQGCRLWEKYKNYFLSTNYIFLKTKNFIDNDLQTIIVINKKAFLKIVQENLLDFRKVLGKAITPENLLEKVLQSDDVFRQVLKNHQGLIGTLLGYGKNNAWLFHENYHAHMNHYYFTLEKLDPIIPESSDCDSTLESFNNNTALRLNALCVNLPYFTADPNSSETKALKTKYMKQFKQILASYREGDFLEITLKRLSSDN